MEKAYDHLGEWFEYLNNDCGYEEWSQYLLSVLSNDPNFKKGVDLGCGNGYFTRFLAKQGYVMTGVDISPAMLSKAQQLSTQQGLRSEYVLGDASKLVLKEKADFIVSINDCFNYVPPAKLISAFKKIRTCLNKNGLFLFDTSAEHKLKHVLASNVFAEDRDDITLLWFNSLAGNKLTMDLTLFVKDKSGSYQRYDEQHVQYAHSIDEISAALTQAGFSIERIEGHLGSTDLSERVNFIARRI